MTGIDVTPAVRAATERITPEWDLDASILWPQVADDAVTAALPVLAEHFAQEVIDGREYMPEYIDAAARIRAAATPTEEADRG